MDLNEAITSFYDGSTDSMTGHPLPETIAFPSRNMPQKVKGISVWNRGMCTVAEIKTAGSWYVYLLKETGVLNDNLHIMAFRPEDNTWLHLWANFDYVPFGKFARKGQPFDYDEATLAAQLETYGAPIQVEDPSDGQTGKFHWTDLLPEPIRKLFRLA